MVDTLYQCKQECITHKLEGQNERKDKCRKGVAPQDEWWNAHAQGNRTCTCKSGSCSEGEQAREE